MDADLRKHLRSARDRPPEEVRSNRKGLLIAGGGLLLFLAAVGKLSPFGGFHVPGPNIHLPGPNIHINGGDAPDEGQRGPVTIDAAALYQAYADDEDAADERFEDREMVVTGEFLRTVPDGYGSIDMRLKTPNPEAPLGVDLDGHSVDAATALKPGQMVTVSCRQINGSGNDHWLQACVIQPPADDGAAEAPVPGTGASGSPASPPAPPAPPPPPGAPGNS